MNKIRDRVVLSVLAGVLGNAAKTLIDEVSLRAQISQRSFRETAAGVWVSKKSEASNPKGQVLGELLDIGMATVGAFGLMTLLSRTGRDHYPFKGALLGLIHGSAVSGIVSGLPQNKVRPKDAASNLSYMLSHAIYGLVAGVVMARLGHPSLFDVRPVDYLAPTERTSEEQMAVRRGRVLPEDHRTTLSRRPPV